MPTPRKRWWSSSASASAPASRSGHGDRDEEQRVAQRDAEDLVVHSSRKFAEPNPVAAPDQVVLEQRQAERDRGRQHHEHGEPSTYGAQQERQAAAFSRLCRRSVYA